MQRIEDEKARRIIDYALCFLCANFDDDEDEDVGFTVEELTQFVLNWKKENGCEC